MSRSVFLFVAFLMVGSVALSQKYYTKEGQLSFEASVKAFEPVAAVHNGATAVLDVSSGKLAVLALVRGFRFRNATMEEHFNENYIESDVYPKASFTGVIEDFNLESINDAREVTVTGNLTIREKNKPVTVQGILVKTEAGISLKSSFDVSPADFEIEIPKIVRNKITDVIHVEINFLLIKK